MRSPTRLLAAAVLALALVACASAHGMMTKPRLRGGLKCPTRNISPKELTNSAPVDYCPHCANAGGRWHVKNNGGGYNWRPYKPMEGNNRGGFGLCGDPAGNYDHSRNGKYGNPPNFRYAAVYKPGSVVNFEFDATANHGGYLEYYLCDVSQMPYQDISFQGFPQRCHQLKRVAHASCESGGDRDCGPIDPKFPSRWVLPCGNAGGDTGDQILGGNNGKMAYQIPDVHIEQGVIQMYWLTQNDCIDNEGFMANYNYPHAWNGCHGDGGSIGGKPQHHLTCDHPSTFPEEFWNCADVQVKHLGHGEYNPNDAYGPGHNVDHGYSGGGGHHGSNNDGGHHGHNGHQGQDDNRASSGGNSWWYKWSWSSTNGYKSSSSNGNQGRHRVVEDGNCIPNYSYGCNSGLRCCKSSFSCHSNQCK